MTMHSYYQMNFIFNPCDNNEDVRYHHNRTTKSATSTATATSAALETKCSAPKIWSAVDNLEQSSSSESDNDNDSSSSSSPIQYLFPEILTHVFKFLDVSERGRVAQVCKYWRDVVYDKAVWRGVEAKMHLWKSGNSSVYKSLTKRGINKIQILSLKRSLRELVSEFPGVVSLKLSGCYSVTDTTLASAFAVMIPGGISLQLPLLTTLDLSLCKQVSDVSLARIASRAPNLINLELGGCCQVSDCGLLIIAWGLKKLQRLNLRSCGLITDVGIGFLAGIVRPSHLQEPRVHNFLTNLGLVELNKANFDNPHLDLITPALAVNATIALPPNLPTMSRNHRKRFAVRSSIEIGHGGPVSSLVDQHSFPKKPRLGDIVYIPSQGPQQQKCVICQQVDITLQTPRSGSSDPGNLLSSNNHNALISRLKSQSKHRKSIHSSSGVNYRQPAAYLQDFFPEKIGEHTVFGTTDLQFLGIQDCQKLSDECLTFIGQGGLPKLQSINLSFCIHISDSGLRELAKLTSISEINLRSCDNVTDLGLFNLSDCGRRLMSLDVSFCDKIGNSGLGYISQYMPRLKSLSMSACDISDEGLMRVANILTHLETLNIGQCSKITDTAVKIISEKCLQIKYIDLYGCTNVSVECLSLIRQIPTIKTLNLGLWNWR